MKVKFKYSVVVFLMVVIFATNVSCQDEAINLKDVKTSVEQSKSGKYGDAVKLTSDNYITENTLYIVYLEQKLADNKEEKVGLLQLVEKGDKKAEIEFNALIEDEKAINASLNNAYADAYLFDFKPKPNPCPRPTTCLPKEFKYLVKLDTDKIASFTVYIKKNVVGEGVSDDIAMPSQKGVNAIKISMDGNGGESFLQMKNGYVKINKIDKNGNQISYTVDVDIQ